MQGDCKAVETPLQRRRVITGSWVFAGRLLSPKPASVAAGAAGISGSAHRPPAATFAFPQADSVAASRVMPSFPRPPRFAEGISVLRGKSIFWIDKVLALYIAALCRGIANPLKLPVAAAAGCLQEVGCLQGACLARNPQVLRQAPQEISGSAHRPPAATFAFRQAGSVAASRVMPPFPRPPRFAEGIFRRWRIRKGRAKRHISPRATVSRFFVASVEYARGMLHKVGFIFTCGNCDSVRMRYW